MTPNRVIALVLTAVLLVGLIGTVARRPDAHAGTAGPVPRTPKAALLVLENTSYSQIIGSPGAPYLNHLARRGALATNYYAIGHPSLPNYLALTGGSTFAVTRDCNACSTSAPSLIDQLDGAGIPWRAYFESIPSAGFRGVHARHYTKHYNPFAYYNRVEGDPFARDRVVGFGPLRRDLRHRTLPRFSWIAPDLVHDGHSASLRRADRFASRLVPKVLRALGHDGVLYVTWDEGAGRAGPGGGHVPLIAVGGPAASHTTSAVYGNHYSLLHTIEGGFGLPPLHPEGSQPAPALSGLLRPPMSRA